MKNIKEALSTYTGSTKTYDVVAEQIRKRWGDREVKNYDPYTNALTFSRWMSLGYKVIPGEKALVSTTFIKEDDEDGKASKRIPHKVFLFYYKQVEKVND